LKIRKVEAFLMSCPFEKPLLLPFYGGERTILKRDAMFIRVTADNGLKGYGPGPAHERAANEIRDVIGPFLEERDPAQWRTFNFQADLETTKTYRAVEVAVLDLVAKFEGAPLSEIVGGRKRDRIKLYGSAGMYMSPEKYAEEAAAIAGMGFTAYKMRPARGPQKDLETAAKMREAVGPNMGLMLDAHGWWRMGDKSYSHETIVQLIKDMSVYHPYWLEEPMPPDDHAAYRRLRQTGIVPIASGEHEPDEASFLDMIQSGAVDFAQMDVCCQGGFEMGRRIFEATAKQGIRFAFHSWGTLLEVIAAAQIGICWGPEVVEWLEYPCHQNNGRPGMYPFQLADDILTEPLQIEKGDLVVPKKPGIGVEVDESVVERYPYMPGPWSIFKIDSPPETLAVSGDHSVKWVEAETR
jgi:L-alanine-DL-glutamate epimerase-like enolase superfamily enzyme